MRPAGRSDVYGEDLMAQKAVLLMEDHAHLSIGMETQERLLLLFTDSLVIAKTKSLYLKLKARVCLSDVWVASCIHHVTNRKFSTKTSFVIGWPTINYAVTFSSSETKEKWLRALQWHSGRVRQSLMSNRILLNVQLFDHTAMTEVMVDINSTAESVVQTIVQNQSLTGPVSNYSLCVGHKEEMFPLIGHELPFCIVTHSHNVNTLQQPPDKLGSGPLPKPPVFTVKNRPASYTLSHTGSSMKHKRKKSLIGWALRRGYSSQSVGKSNTDPAPNMLFGQSLSSVCNDGNLPKPIMDLLCVLYREGPKTLGIFRRSANAKSCRVLKERLNSGFPVPLLGESAFTAASLITEFLRRLPDSVLCCDIFDDWMEVLEMEDHQEKCTSAKSVLERLPQVNHSLLCYLFLILHRIHSCADVNQMTAANLALCVAPSVLWRNSVSSTEEENQNNLEVAALVRFLIENSPSIFGEEVETTFSELWNAAEQETDDLSASASFLLHSSSSETDPDGLPCPLLSADLHPFLPLSFLHREVHPLKITMARAGVACSYGSLAMASSRSSASVRSLNAGKLSETRNRCLSEPSVCLEASGMPNHLPVLRQFSCESEAISGRISQSQGQVRKGAGKGRYAFWKSPQFSSRFRHPAQRLASMSSLSSTTTASSLSSLDSTVSFSSSEPIQSPGESQPRPFLFGSSARLRPLTPEMPRKLWNMAFTYEEFGDGQDESKGVYRSHITLKDEHKDSDDAGKTKEGIGQIMESDKDEKIGATADKIRETQPEGSESSSDESCAEARPNPDDLEPLSSAFTPGGDKGDSQENEPQLRHENDEKWETSVAHICLERPALDSDANVAQMSANKHNLDLPLGQERVNRMKITFFPTVGRVMLKQQTKEGAVADAGSSGITMETSQAGSIAQVNIPQTLFYRQDAQLLLHSSQINECDQNNSCVCVSTATEDNANPSFSNSEVVSDSISAETTDSICSSDPSHILSISDSSNIGHAPPSICSTDNINNRPNILPANENKSPRNFRHTIRIRLPTNVRNTVRAYFTNTNTLANTSANNSANANVSSAHTTSTPNKTQNKQLFSSKLHWQKAGSNTQPYPQGGVTTASHLLSEEFQA
ncbi:uncharacterized protein arhgap20b isoform X2 [Hoplias malabaricus]|uniref:uncharacterized protein arhgap20b isoform X2 n=1 Tax=Hoplias malabaricus TaxID=27720 RepID=UPI0034636C88